MYKDLTGKQLTTTYSRSIIQAVLPEFTALLNEIRVKIGRLSSLNIFDEVIKMASGGTITPKNSRGFAEDAITAIHNC